MKKPKAQASLENMAEGLSSKSPPDPKPHREQQKPAVRRTGLKHIGGYFEIETVEKVAILRARLRLDNSGLIKLAVDELHSKHQARRAFGEA